MSDNRHWCPEHVELGDRCRRLVRSHEHLRDGRRMLVVKIPPHIVIQHCLVRGGEMSVFYRGDPYTGHTTCYVEQNGRMFGNNDHWFPWIREAVVFLRERMLLDDIAGV